MLLFHFPGIRIQRKCYISCAPGIWDSNNPTGRPTITYRPTDRKCIRTITPHALKQCNSRSIMIQFCRPVRHFTYSCIPQRVWRVEWRSARSMIRWMSSTQSTWAMVKYASCCVNMKQNNKFKLWILRPSTNFDAWILWPSTIGNFIGEDFTKIVSLVHRNVKFYC